MTSWTAMNNLATNDLVTEADMDAIRGNIEYLLDPDMDEVGTTASFNTTSTTPVYITGARATLTTHGGKVMVVVTASGSMSTAGDAANFTIYVDGVVISGSMQLAQILGTSQGVPNFTYIVDGLAAGSHTFDIYVYVTGGGGGTFTGTVSRIQAVEI